MSLANTGSDAEAAEAVMEADEAEAAEADTLEEPEARNQANAIHMTQDHIMTVHPLTVMNQTFRPNTSTYCFSRCTLQQNRQNRDTHPE